MTARRWPYAVCAIALGIAAAALLGEVTARVAGAGPMRTDDDWQAEHRRLYETTGESGTLPYDLRPSSRAVFAYRGAPVEYRINEDGIRADRRYAVPKPAGVRRIVMLGDSVLFGLGVAREATFAARIEAALGVEVVNGGIGGYNTAAERLWFERRGRRYEPDAVVLVYCPNDVDDPVDHFAAHTAERLSQQPEELIPNPEYHAQAAVRGSSGPGPQRSWRVAAAEMADWTMRQSALATLCLRSFAHGGSRPYERCLFSAADSASKELAWLRRQLAQLHAQTNAPAYFVYVPIAYELHSANTAYLRGRANVARAAADAGFHVVDVIMPLEAVPVPYLDVTHLSAAGHAIVANALAAALRGGFANP